MPADHDGPSINNDSSASAVFRADTSDARDRTSSTRAINGAARLDEVFALLHANAQKHMPRANRTFVGVVGGWKLMDVWELAMGDAVTVGRHRRCQIRVHDESIAGRHLVVHVATERGHQHVIRMWDLHTSLPFVTENGTSTRAAAAAGPLFVRLGPYVVAAVPAQYLRTPDPIEAWRRLPVREFARVEAPPTDPSRVDDVSIVSLLPAPRVLDASSSGDPAAEITMEFGRTTTSYVLDAHDLDRGILLGRDQRCFGNVPMDRSVSRVHALIVSRGDRVWALDTASTNGVAVGARRRRATRLQTQEVLTLGSFCTVRWRRI